MKVLFVSDYKFKLNDGINKAVNILGFDRYNIGDEIPNFEEYDFVLGHGAFHSRVDGLLRSLRYYKNKGLCIGGNTHRQDTNDYQVLFYETEWVKNFLNLQGNLVHAFGTNTQLYNTNDITLNRYKCFDYISVGSLAKWKRHELLKNKKGVKMVIGEIQKGNYQESFEIANELMKQGIGVLPQIDDLRLATIYHSSRNVYVPADIFGGGERAVLEARACGINVEVEDDNPKLKELLTSPIWDENYYANQLKKGIELCLKK
jgi:hypothetical protein